MAEKTVERGMSALRNAANEARSHADRLILTLPNSGWSSASVSIFSFNSGDSFASSFCQGRLLANNKVDHVLSFRIFAASGKTSFRDSHKGSLPRHDIIEAISSGLWYL